MSIPAMAFMLIIADLILPVFQDSSIRRNTVFFKINFPRKIMVIDVGGRWKSDLY